MSGQKTLADQAVGAVKMAWSFVKVVAGAFFQVNAERQKDLNDIKKAVDIFTRKYGARPPIWRGYTE